MANNITLSYPSAFYHQFLDKNGKPLTGGKLYTYSAGTPTPVPTYKTIGDTSYTNTNTNPIILDNAGMAYIVIETDKAYKFVLFDKNDAKIAEWDNVTGNIGGGGGSSEDIVVVGTPNEIDVSGSVTQGVKRYVISLSNSVKSTILYLVGLYTNVLNSLGNKADKVQGATAGNLAALDASGNLTDSGSKASDFKTKQTPVTNPSASGAGLEFIDSISQDANGEITPHKKSVQDGTTAQKGVVQLQDSIGSTESATDKAVTPHAVREAINAAVSSAYHAAGTKTVAQLTSSLLVAENEGCVYNVTDSGTTTSDFVDGAGHPINAGDNVGVCDVGGGVYKFDLLSGFVDLTNYLTKTGDASNATSTLTKASGDTSTMTSGGKLSAIFTAISSFFASLKALAFKDMVSNSDINGTISDSHIASASTWNGKQNALPTSGSASSAYAINISGKSSASDSLATKHTDLTNFDDLVPSVDEVVQYNINGNYTNGPSGAASSGYWGILQVFWRNSSPYQMFFNSTNMWIRYTTTKTDSSWTNWNAWTLVNSNSIPSVINNLASTSATDALSAAQGKVLNEKFPTFGYASFNGANVGYKAIGYIEPPTEQNGNVYLEALVTYSVGGGGIVSSMELVEFNIRRDDTTYSNRFERKLIFGNYLVNLRFKAYYSDGTHKIWLYANKSVNDNIYCSISISVLNVHGCEGSAKTNAYKLGSYSIENDPGIPELVAASATISTFSVGQKGSPTTPVYVDSNGQVQPCTASNTLKSNTATLYIAGYTDNNIPYYHVKDIKNGCVNHVDFSGITNSTCDITFEAPTLSTGEEYDYIISLEGYTNNTGVSTGPHVENCKQVLRYDYVNNLWIGEPLFLQATDWRQICVVRGNTCEWKRVALS